MLISVPRFLCPKCLRTTSCLPSFALSYRMISSDTLEAFLQGRMKEKGIAQHRDLLESYRRRWEERAPEIEAVTGAFFGPLSDEPPAQRLLNAMMRQWGNLRQGCVELLETFGEAPLKRYRIHDWARVARGSVDPLRRPRRMDSS